MQARATGSLYPVAEHSGVSDKQAAEALAEALLGYPQRSCNVSECLLRGPTTPVIISNAPEHRPETSGANPKEPRRGLSSSPELRSRFMLCCRESMAGANVIVELLQPKAIRTHDVLREL